MIPTKEQAWDLLCEYNEGEFHRLHARIVGDVMRYFAVQLGYADEADFWQTVGILHDLDFEQYPDQHCTKEAEILREKGVDERLIHAVVSHGYLLTVDVQPEHQMEKVLYATDELTGLIGAVVRMLPTKSVQAGRCSAHGELARCCCWRSVFCRSKQRFKISSGFLSFCCLVLRCGFCWSLRATAFAFS